MGLAPTRSAARQLVNHGHIKVNDKKVDIPSFRVKVGDVIVLGSSSRKSKLFEGVSERLAKIEFPSWLTVDTQKVSGKVLNAPIIDDPNFNAKSIIEFYSR
jgi:small subunit ribosomal protein S4